MQFGKIDANDDPELEVCTLFLTVTEDWRTIRLWDEKKKKKGGENTQQATGHCKHFLSPNLLN